MRTAIAITLLALCVQAAGQNLQLTGDVLDEKAQPLPSAVAVLLDPADSTLLYFSVAGNNGKFELRNVKRGNYVLQVSLLGFNTLYRKLSVPLQDGENIGSLMLTQKTFNIGEVSVNADRIPMRIRKDTIEYDAKAYKVKTDGVAEDLIRKLPGMEVDRAGNIKAMGEDVENVLVDGKEFFGNDPKVATRNLPADAIEKVQLFDRQSDESRFTGIDDGQRNPTLNIQLDKDKKNGIFGDVTGGYGTGNRGEASGKLYRFSQKKQFAALGMINNVNKFGFSLGDYINFSGGLSSFSPGGGHVMLTKESTFPVNFGQPVYGTGTNGAAGLNFSVSKSQDNRVFFSYLGNGSGRKISESSKTWNYLPDGSYRVDEAKNEVTGDSTHRFNFGVRKRFGEKQNLIINGGLSLNSSSNPMNSTAEGFMNDVMVNSIDRNTSETLSMLSGNTDASYQLKLWEGKTIFRLSGRAGYSGNNTNSRFLNNTRIINPYVSTVTNQFYNLRSDVQDYSGSAAITQRVSRRSSIDLSVAAGYTSDNLRRRQGDIEGGMIPDSSLSPDFIKTEKYIRPGLTWKLSTAKSQVTLAITSPIGSYTTVLNDDRGKNTDYFYLTPRASWEYAYRSGRRLMAEYNTSVNTPGASQLLPVVNNINTLSLFYGNRDLKPEYVHNAGITWWLFDQFSFTTLLAGLNMSYTANAIGYERSVNDNSGQIISLLNLRDRWTAGGNIDFSTPIKPLGIKINLSLNENYNKGLSMVNGRENLNSSLTHRISLTVDNRKKDRWDIETGSAITITDSKYSIRESLNNVYQDLSWFGDIRYTPGSHFSMMASADITSYSAKTFNESRLIPLLGAEVSYSFMKNQRGILTLTGTDLLNRNKGIERTGDMNFLVERRSSMLGRYIMLSFKYRLNKFGNNSGGINIQIKKR